MEQTGHEPKPKQQANEHTVASAQKIASELVEQFRPLVNSEIDGETHFEFNRMEQTTNAKRCAHIVCDTIIKRSYKWEHDFVLFTEVKNQIDKM